MIYGICISKNKVAGKNKNEYPIYLIHKRISENSHMKGHSYEHIYILTYDNVNI